MIETLSNILKYILNLNTQLAPLFGAFFWMLCEHLECGMCTR